MVCLPVEAFQRIEHCSPAFASRNQNIQEVIMETNNSISACVEMKKHGNFTRQIRYHIKILDDETESTSK